MSKVIGVTVGTTLSASSVANALKGKVSGSAVAMTDVSPLEHNIGVKVSSKNLCPTTASLVEVQAPIYAGDTETTFHFGYAITLPAGTYTVSAQRVRPTTIDTVKDRYIYCVKNTDTNFFRLGDMETGLKSKTYTIADGEILYIYNGYDGRSYGDLEKTAMAFAEYDMQIELGTTATAYTPFVDLDSVTLKTFGENLWDEEWRNGTYNATTGAFEARNDIVANANPIMVKEGEVYAVNVGNINVFGYLADGTLKYPNTSSKGNYSTITITSGIKYINFRFGSAYGNAYKNDICVRKENAERNALYVPYEGKTYNGTVESVTSIYPSTTIVTDTAGVTIEAEYNRDINKAFAELLAKIGG